LSRHWIPEEGPELVIDQIHDIKLH